jgi:hypothetical protein
MPSSLSHPVSRRFKAWPHYSVLTAKCDADRRRIETPENLFTLAGFSDIHAVMCHLVTIGSHQYMTCLGGPVENVAH